MGTEGEIQMNYRGYYCNEKQIYTMTTTLDVKNTYLSEMGDILFARLIAIYMGKDKSIDLFTNSDEFAVYLSKAEMPKPVITFRRIEILYREGQVTGKKVMLV